MRYRFAAVSEWLFTGNYNTNNMIVDHDYSEKIKDHALSYGNKNFHFLASGFGHAVNKTDAYLDTSIDFVISVKFSIQTKNHSS